MKLLLMRHGEALHDSQDSLRPLSEKGRREAADTANQIKTRGYPIQIIYHSRKKRAAETARIAAEILNQTQNLRERDGLNPEDPVDRVISEIENNRFDEPSPCLMIVGHMPFLGDFLHRLVSEKSEFPAFRTGTAVCLENPAGSCWKIETVFHPA